MLSGSVPPFSCSDRIASFPLQFQRKMYCNDREDRKSKRNFRNLSLFAYNTFGPSIWSSRSTITSADFCLSISMSRNIDSSIADKQNSPGNANSPSRLCLQHMRSHFPYRYWTLKIFDLSSSVIASCGSCSSGQRFACSFLQISSRDEHPCRPANTCPCRLCKELPSSNECALPGAQKKSLTLWSGSSTPTFRVPRELEPASSPRTR
jgi:hypothetical protein